MCTLAGCVVHMQTHNAKASNYLLSHFVNGKHTNITAEDISKHQNVAAGLLNYPTRKGIPVEWVNPHSLRGRGANVLALSEFSDMQIQKMG